MERAYKFGISYKLRGPNFTSYVGPQNLAVKSVIAYSELNENAV
jgi:hypothetical protein